MKKSFVKRMMACVMTLCIVLTSVQGVFAAGFVQHQAIDRFITVCNWNKSAGYVPEGTMAGSFKYIYPYDDSDNVSTVMYAAVEAEREQAVKFYVPFEETVADGMLHISFDACLDEDALGGILIQGIGNDVNNNPTDVEPGENESTEPMIPIVGINYRPNGTGEVGQVSHAPHHRKTADYPSADNEPVQLTQIRVGSGGLKGFGWHKYDIIMDYETDTITYFLDGTQIGDVWEPGDPEEDPFRDIKALYVRFRPETTSTSPQKVEVKGLYMDNLYVHNYDKSAATIWDEIKIGVDYKTPLNEKDGGKILLSFSETLTDADDYSIMESWGIDSEFLSIRNTATGAIVDPDTYYIAPNGDMTGLVVEFDENVLAAGKYEISVAGTDYTGAASGKTVTGKAYVTVESSVVNQDTTRKYYLNEDFENYKENSANVPAGWIPNAKDGTIAGHWEAREGKDGGTALTQAWNTERLYYDFGSTIKGGKFTTEFDLYQENGGARIGFLNEADLADPEKYWAERLGSNGTNGPKNNSYESTGPDYKVIWSQQALDAAKAAGETITDEETWKNDWITANFATKWTETLAADTAEGVALRKRMQYNNIAAGANVLGGLKAAGNGSLTLGYNTARLSYFGSSAWVDANGSDIAAPVLSPNAWHHVKIDFDIDARTMAIEVDGTKYIAKNKFIEPQKYGAYRSDILGTYKVTNIQGAAGTSVSPYEYMSGIRGIAIGTGDDKMPVRWDNIKVYTEDNLNLNLNYDGMDFSDIKDAGVCATLSSSYKIWRAAGTDPTENIDAYNYRYSAVEGKDAATKSNDKALQLYGWRDSKNEVKGYVIPFERIVPGSTPFEIELDIKTGKEKKDMFTLGVLAPEDLQLNDGYNANTLTNNPKRMIWEHVILATTNDNAQSLDEYPFIAMKDHYYGFDNADYGTRITTTNGAEIKYAPGGWYHIKMTVNPTSNDVTCKYEITDDKGNTYTSDYISIMDGDKTTPKYYKKGIAGLLIMPLAGFQEYIPLGSTTATSATQANPYDIRIDNVKVREVELNEVKLTDAVVNKLDGTTEKLGALLSRDTKSITLNFSGALKDTNGIKVKNARTLTDINVTKTLSEAGTSVEVVFDAMPANDTKVSLYIDSNYDPRVQADGFNFKVVAAADGVYSIDNFRLYEYVAYRNGTEGGVWVPYTAASLDSAAGKQLKVVVGGLNTTGSAVNAITGIIAGYDANGKLVYTDVSKLNFANGKFETEIPGLSLSGVSEIKMFVWDANIKPASEGLEYSVN